MRLPPGSRWLPPLLIVATLFASAPSPRSCPIRWTDLPLAVLAQCGGPVGAPDPSPSCDRSASCPIMAGSAHHGACPMAAAASCAGTGRLAEGSPPHGARPAGPPTRCVTDPSIRSLWLPRAPIARYPGTAVLVRIPAVEPASRPVALARSTPPVRPTAREPDARPPVRGPPRLA